MNQFVRLGFFCLLSFFLLGFQSVKRISGSVGVKTLDTGTQSITQYVLTGENRAVLQFESDPHLKPYDKIDVSGFWYGDVFIVDWFELRERARRTDTPLVRDPMRHTTAILAMGDTSTNRNAALNAMNRADVFWMTVSRGYDSLEGGVFEKYNIDYNNSDCNFNNTDNLVDKLIAAFENDGYDRDDYDHILTIVPRNCGSWTGAWAYIGGVTDNGQLRFAQISMYKDNVVTAGFFAHELGHNIGFNHARSMDCGRDPYYRPRGNGCDFSEYGNWNDNMGNGDDEVWYNGAYQRYLGWIGAKHVVTAGKASDFNLQPIDDTFDCGIQALRIPIPDENGTYFYIEYRHTRDDGAYSGTGPTNNKRDSVLITRSRDGVNSNDSSFTDRVELDVARYDGAEVGKLYDLGKGVSVRVRSMGAVAKVAIAMPGNSNHRDDDLRQISPQSDGTYGEIDCNVVEEPRIAMSKDVYEVNEKIEVFYFDLPESDTNWIGIFNRGDSHDNAIEWKYVQGATGVETFGSLPKGEYDARLFFNDVADLKYEARFRVRDDEEPPPEVECKGNTLKKKKKLKPGQYLCSKNESFAFGLKQTGRLQLIELPFGNELWTAGVCCEQNSFLRMRKNGDLVHRVKDGPILFQSGTAGNKGAKLVMRNTGVAVIINKAKEVIWSTGETPEQAFIKMSKDKYNIGEKIEVSYGNLPPNDLNWIGLYQRNANDEDYLDWKYVITASGTVAFDGLNVAGKYEARLYYNDSYDLELKVNFEVVGDQVDDPYIEMSKNKYNVGEQIGVKFFNLPDDNFWIGLYNAGAAHEDFLVWQWAQGGNGSVVFDGMANAGDYNARLFFTDSYDLVFETSFKVEGDGGEGDVDLTLNPYNGVNWDWDQFKANYHAHTDRSDGSDHPATVIDGYYQAGYKILAITDHNRITWPWSDYGRDPNSLGMLAVKSDEWSRSHHMNPFHNFSRESSNMEDGIPHLQSSNGVGQWNHPLRYSDAGDWDWYVGWARNYTAMVGIEVINGTNTAARNLWDNINENFFRTDGRFVWGHANDDSHHRDHIGKGFMFMLMPTLSKAANLEAMRKGRSYFCVEPGGSGSASVPRLRRVVVNNTAKTISLTVEGQSNIKWFGPGTNRVGTGNTFDYSNYKNKSFVRAVLDGNNGDCYTQPFGFVTRN